jgi:mono/diheme cytochrome c family protein
MKLIGFPLALACLGLLMASGLAAQEGRTLNPSFVEKTNSPSGLKWIAGNRGSPYMHPGISCIGCHQTAGGEAPNLAIAGTVYTKLDEGDDVLGVEGAVVQITDSKGQVLKLTANKAGNFLLRERGTSLAMPISAVVIFKGAERKMFGSKRTGDCLQCHTAKGAGGAPGRIIIP